ncbi:hypothetical protein QZH41_011740 [Actinostola sp. cb2023]|nr:hypothetical protein QZH41_011740 [Actinostola sp. cb2023]
MEVKLFNEFREMRVIGMRVKEWCFRGRCKQLMEELHPGVEFKMSNHWFDRFKSRYDISLRRPTNAAQKEPETLRSMQQFHRYIRKTAIEKSKELDNVQEGIVGPWQLSDIANMDQTPLQFCYNTKGATYAEFGEKTVWIRTSGEGHDKRQCTVQLTIYADGEPRLKPLLIFKGKGKRIQEKETKQYDYRVVDAHRTQTTEKVKTIVSQECNTTLGLVTPGTTSKVQPLDVVLNAVFKKAVDKQATEHMAANPEQFVTGKVSSGDAISSTYKTAKKEWKKTGKWRRRTVQEEAKTIAKDEQETKKKISISERRRERVRKAKQCTSV